MAGGIVDVLRHLRALRIVGHIGNQIKCHAGECLDEGLVNGGGYRAGALIGDMRCNWVDFFIEIVFDFRVLDGWREHCHHVGAKTLRDDEGGVVGAGIHAVDGFVLVHELPVEVMIGAQGIGDGLANVDGDWHEIGLISLVDVRHGNFECLGVAVWIPAGGDVVPGIQRRYDHQSHGHDHRDYIARGLAHIACEDLPDELHRAPPCAGFVSVMVDSDDFDESDESVEPVRSNGVSCSVTSPISGSVSTADSADAASCRPWERKRRHT